MEGLRNQSLRHWVRVSPVTTFRVITKQGGDGGIHHHMCTQGRYLRSPTSPVLAVHCRHSIKRKQATSQSSLKEETTATIIHIHREHIRPKRVRRSQTTSAVKVQRWLLWLKGVKLKCQVLSKVWAYFARDIRRRSCSLSHCQFLRVFITGYEPRTKENTEFKYQ